MAVVLSTSSTAAYASETAVACTVANAAEPQGGGPIDPAVTLQPEPNSQSRVVNFGDDRDPESQRFAINAEPPLTRGDERRLSLVADVIVRTGSDTAETVTFPEPKFSPLRRSGNGKRITFEVCLTPPEDLPPGQYTGLVTVDGPEGVESTAVTVTANAKDESLFWRGAIITLLIAFVVLWYKRAADIHAEHVRTDPAAGWGQSFRACFKDIGWVVSTIAALAVTGAALYVLWERDPSWGATGTVGSLIALIGAGLASIGAKTVLSPSGK